MKAFSEVNLIVHINTNQERSSHNFLDDPRIIVVSAFIATVSSYSCVVCSYCYECTSCVISALRVVNETVSSYYRIVTSNSYHWSS